MTAQTDPNSMPDNDSCWQASLAVALVVLALLGAAAGTATAQSDRPTVRVDGGNVTVDGTTTAGIVLTKAPNGLSGYYLEFTVENSDAVRIASASYPEPFRPTTEPDISDNRTTVMLEAADAEGAINHSATNVTLATVELVGVSSGKANLSVRVRQFDTDNGSRFQPATRAGMVTVQPQTTPSLSASVQQLGNPGGQARINYTLTNTTGQHNVSMTFGRVPAALSLNQNASNFGNGSLVNDTVLYTTPSGTQTTTVVFDIAASANPTQTFTVETTLTNQTGIITDRTQTIVGNIQQSPPQKYDKDESGVIEINEIRTAINDFARGELDLRAVRTLINYWANGTTVSRN